MGPFASEPRHCLSSIASNAVRSSQQVVLPHKGLLPLGRRGTPVPNPGQTAMVTPQLSQLVSCLLLDILYAALGIKRGGRIGGYIHSSYQSPHHSSHTRTHEAKPTTNAESQIYKATYFFGLRAFSRRRSLWRESTRRKNFSLRS